MTRAQNLATADELVFIDSSSSCDATQSSVTMVLVASQAGAIPAAVLLHEGQSAESYQRAFSLLQQHCPRCFNGRQVSAVMMLPFNTVYSDSVSQTLCYHHHHLLLHRYHFLPAALRAAQICRYLVYSEADFEVFRPAGATRSTDGGEIWHGGGCNDKGVGPPKLGVKFAMEEGTVPNFTPIGATTRV